MARMQWIKELRERCPRVHCITNYVTAGYVADMILAAGASPIMAHGIREVEDITSICQSLVLNIGTLSEDMIPSMLLAAGKAAALSLPVILDPVGVAASAFRKQSALRIIREARPSVIRGNEAEILALVQAMKGEPTDSRCGVDSVVRRRDAERLAAARALKELTGAVVVMTGDVDIIAGGDRDYVVHNGHHLMTRITGSGCMLDGVIGAFCGLLSGIIFEPPGEYREQTERGQSSKKEVHFLEKAVASALCSHGLCGELAAEKVRQDGGGTGSFRMYFIDYMSILDDEMLERGKKIEVQ